MGKFRKERRDQTSAARLAPPAPQPKPAAPASSPAPTGRLAVIRRSYDESGCLISPRAGKGEAHA